MFNSIDRVAIGALCMKYGVPLEWALGLAEVESAGRAWWTIGERRMPAINLEGHYLYKYLPPGKRQQAVSLGLANKTAGKTKVPTSYAQRYAMLEQWQGLDKDAALMSISMGVGQVMGAHYHRLAFKTVQEMWALARQSLAGQVELMLRFITTDDALVQAIAKNQYAVVAKLYNGPAYRRNKYDTKIKAAVSKYRVGRPSSEVTYDASVESKRINKLGFDTVEAFQRANGLDADGIIGPITIDAITAVERKNKRKTIDTATKVGGGIAATTAVSLGSDIVSESTSGISAAEPAMTLFYTLQDYAPQIALAAMGLVVVGIIGAIVIRKMREA